MLALAALSALAACSDGSTGATAAPSPATSAPATSGASAVAPGDRVVVTISIDGLNPDAITSLGRTGAPHLWRLIDQGASTLNARTTHERTSTLPNHTAMLTGRGVEGAGGTSITFNDDNGSTLAAVHGSYVPSMFDIAHDRGVRTALFAEKDKFRFLVRSFDRNHGAEDTTGTDDGPDKIDLAEIAPSDRLVQAVTDAVTRHGAGLVFWHIAAPDRAGHAHGWLSPAYLTAVQDADAQVGLLLAALDARPAVKARTMIALTADHGGAKGADAHTDVTVLADYRIPFITWGRGVAPGADLYDLSADLRTDPGIDRPGYDGPQPVRNTDLAATVLASLGLPNLPSASTAVTTR